METRKNTILVPIGDLSNDLTVIQKAAEMARNTGNTLHFLHVKEVDNIRTGGYGYMEMIVLEDWKEDELSNLLKEKAKGVVTEIEIVPHADIVDCIVERAKNYEMIIIGHHHTGLIEEFFINSTSEKVINRVDSDVFIVHT